MRRLANADFVPDGPEVTGLLALLLRVQPLPGRLRSLTGGVSNRRRICVRVGCCGVFEDQSGAGCILLVIDDVRLGFVRPFDEPNLNEHASGDFYGFLVRCDAASHRLRHRLDRSGFTSGSGPSRSA